MTMDQVRRTTVWAIVFLGIGMVRCAGEIFGTPCLKDAHCATWQTCAMSAGICVGKECESDAVCGAGAYCRDYGTQKACALVDAGAGIDAGKTDAGAVADGGDGGIEDAGSGSDGGDAGPVDAGQIDAGTGCEGIAAGEDPRGYCTSEASSTCGRDGTCDGQGGCRKWGAGTLRTAPSCATANSEAETSVCSGDGGYTLDGGMNCGVFLCDGDAGYCRKSCGADNHCMGTGYCRAVDGGMFPGECVVKLSQGNLCDGGNECTTGICAQKVCCGTVCGDGARWCERCEADSGVCRGASVMGEEKRVTPASGAAQTRPSLVSGGGGIYYVAWKEGTAEVRVARLSGFDAGSMVVVADAGVSGGPVMTRTSAGLLVGWWSTTASPQSVYVRAVGIDGGALEVGVASEYGIGNAASENVSIASGDGGVLVVWSDENGVNTFDIFTKPANLMGQPYGDGGNDLSPVSLTQRGPSVVWGNGRYGVVWTDNVTGQSDLRFAEVSESGVIVGGVLGIDGGQHLVSPVLGYDGERGEYVVVYVEGGNIYLQRVRDG